MRKAIIILVLMASPAVAQHTSCFAAGATIQCDTLQDQEYRAPPIVGQLLSNQGVNAFQQGQAQAQRRQLMQQQIQMQHMQNCEYAQSHGFQVPPDC